MSASIKLQLAKGASGAAAVTPPPAPTPAPSPTLNALSLSQSSFTIGTPASGSILGATTGSTIAALGLPTGFVINGAARTWSYDGTGSAGTVSPTFTETLAGATNTPRQTVIGITYSAASGVQTITAGGSHTGEQGSGWGQAYGSALSTLPAASTSKIGTGYDDVPVISVFRAPGETLSSSDEVIVDVQCDDPTGINFVEYQLENGTAVQVTQKVLRTTERGGYMFGYPVKLNFTGRGLLKIRAVPNNGYEGVLYHFFEGTGTGSEATGNVRYVDPVVGNDSNNGQTAGTAWKTMTKALSFDGIGQDWQAIEGSLLRMDNKYRIYVISGTGSAVNVDCELGGTSGMPGGWQLRTRQKVIVEKAPGSTARAVIRRLTRSELLLPSWIEFRGVEIDTANVTILKHTTAGDGNGHANPLNGTGSIHKNSAHVKDSGGPAGPVTLGYMRGAPAGESYIESRFTKGCSFSLINSDFDGENPNGGLVHVRGSTIRYVGFLGHFTRTEQSNQAWVDWTAEQVAEGEGRQHADYELTVTSTSASPNGAQYLRIFYSGSPCDFGAAVAPLQEHYMRFLTGAAVGQGGKNNGAGLAFYRMLADGTQDPTIYSYPPDKDGSTYFDTVGFRVRFFDNTAKWIDIEGAPTGVANGDLIRVFYKAHPDMFAVYGNDNPTGQVENIGWQNYESWGPTVTTPWLLQAYDLTANAGRATAITYTAGASTFTFTGSFLRPGDFVRPISGGNLGQYRRVRSISGSTATLYPGETWSNSMAGVDAAVSRGPNRIAMVNGAMHKTSIDDTPGPIDYGVADLLVRNCVVIARSSANVSMLLSTQNGYASASKGAFGIKNWRIRASIITNIQVDPTTGVTGGLKFTDADYHQILGTKVTGGANDGQPTFPSAYTTYVPTAGVARLCAAEDVKHAPWRKDGTVRVAGVTPFGI